MVDAVVGRRYATAIYELAQENNRVEDTHKELSLVMELFEKDTEFKTFITHPLVNREDKKNFMGKILKDFNENTLIILNYLIDKDRIADIRAIVSEYLKIYYEKNSILEAEAIFAVKPLENQLEDLRKKLEAKTNKTVRLTSKIDPTILGGMIVKLGDDIIDASIKSQLEAFRNGI
ncbi:F-type H+-transporting ATPase subunit delta [Hypnocyclicus thermotrophus]|uniref:ATP synthase subunit delta n=1 Tax=Hypnocyclicus thermotrophus TaxID=1627895 RepID=A0AA46I5L1_9FUSO|nr:ATP synthase F1 subunit delta [Hypnocyclicus thermotrophus]TDT70537.1 F-type H+-transporting ATPase subunit delta [Hypnocyclicus thermotrophus]